MEEYRFRSQIRLRSRNQRL